MKSIDIKSLLIGALLCSTVFLATGWQSGNGSGKNWLTTTTDSNNLVIPPVEAIGFEPFDALLDKHGDIKVVWRKRTQ